MNPFKINTTSYNDYEVMKDLQAHCTRCELKSSQAKTWQTWRDAHGIQFAETSPGSNRYDIRKTCVNCNSTTVHRQLATLERNINTSARAGISAKLATRIKVLLKYKEDFGYDKWQEIYLKLTINSRKFVGTRTKKTTKIYPTKK